MKLENLKPGMILYDFHSHRAGNTTLRTWGIWEVRVISVDLEKMFVMASWNGNAPQKYRRGDIARLLVKKPILVKSMFGTYRKQTREEANAQRLSITQALNQ